jgi:aspartate-semialdehyde dehydrogenase
MAETIDIAIVGATGAVGEAMLESLAGRELPLGRLYLVADGEAAGTRLEFKDRYLPVEPLESFDFGKVRLALFATSVDVAAEHAPRANAVGCIVIDGSGAFSGVPDVPLVVPEVNPQRLAEYAKRRLIACPSSAVVPLAIVLKPIFDAVGIERIDIASYQAVSGAGKSAVEELASQTAKLLNVQSIKPRVFPRQIAFNLLPQVDAILDNGHSREELRLLRELRELLGDDGLVVEATAVRVPVFYGHSAAVHLVTRQPLSADAARELLAKTPGVEVVDAQKGAGYPTPVTDAAQQDGVFVGRIREAASQPRGLNFWVVADNVHKGAAINSVQLAEVLVRDYL